MRFLLLLLLCFSLHAEPIEVIVSASPGGPDDTVTRKIVDKLEADTNLQFIVVNKPGAAHSIAYNYVAASAKPTLLMSTSQITSNAVYPQLDEMYTAGHFYNILFVSKISGITNFKQLVELSAARELNFGNGGSGSFSYTAMEALCTKNLRCLSIPFKGAADGMLSLMSNQIDAYAIVSYGSKQFLANDKVVPIYNIITPRDTSWFKLFGKNLNAKDKQTIIVALKSQDPKFYTAMGLER